MFSMNFCCLNYLFERSKPCILLKGNTLRYPVKFKSQKYSNNTVKNNQQLKAFFNYFHRNKYLINDGQNVYQSIFDAVRYLVLSREHSSPFKKRNKIHIAVNDKKTILSNYQLQFLYLIRTSEFLRKHTLKFMVPGKVSGKLIRSTDSYSAY